MNRDDLLDMLAELAEAGEITEEEAAALVRAFDAGEVSPESLPVSTEEQDAETKDFPSHATSEEAALAVLILLTGNRSGSDNPETDATLLLSTMTDAERDREAAQLSDLYEERTDVLTQELKRGEVSPREWHQGMLRLTRQDLYARAALGKGALLTEAERREVEAQVTEQAAFLQRFAEIVAVRRLLGDDELFDDEQFESEEMSGKAIAARAGLYAGGGYAAYWLFRSRSEARRGRLVRYISQDDGGTCNPCAAADADSPYRADGPLPLPGDVCLGAGRCRCRLEYEYDPETYEALL